MFRDLKQTCNEFFSSSKGSRLIHKLKVSSFKNKFVFSEKDCGKKEIKPKFISYWRNSFPLISTNHALSLLEIAETNKLRNRQKTYFLVFGFLEIFIEWRKLIMKTPEVLFIHSRFMKMAADPAVRARLRALLPNSRLVQDYRLDAPRSSTNFNPVIVWMTVLVLVLHDSSVSHDGRFVGKHLNMWISNRLLDSFRSTEPVWKL